MRLASVAAVVALVLATACGSLDRAQSKLCSYDGTSALCLEDGAGDIRVSGHGFLPHSDVHVDVADGAGQLVPVAADGTFPAPGRAVGFLPGLDVEWHRLEGVDKSGRPVAYVVTCAVDAAKQPRCAF